MRMTNKPPAGAGKSQGITKTDQLLKVIEGLGTDKYNNPLAIRTAELAQKTGIDGGSITAFLAAAVRAGRVVMCKVTSGDSKKVTNEYRKAGGLAPPEFKPLNTRRAGIAHGAPAKPVPVTTPAPTLSTPKPDVTEIEPAVLGSPQRVGGLKPPAAGKPVTPPVAPAVAAPATPASVARVVLKKEPTAWPVPAGDVAPRPQRITGNEGIALRIDHDGTLLIATDEGMLEIDPKQSRRLGHFMADTHGVWNPF